VRGNFRSQIAGLWQQSGINQIGESRHKLKEKARANGASGSYEIAQEIGVSSFNTAKAYLNTWRQLAEYGKEGYGLRDIEKITPEMVKDFLESKAEVGVSWQTLTTHAAGCNKLAAALSQYSEIIAARFDRQASKYNFKHAIQSVRNAYRSELERFMDSREYKNPTSLKEALQDLNHKLAASLQHEAGFRLHEASLIKDGQLKGCGVDKYTGKDVGYIEVQGKGGHMTLGLVSVETYNALASHIKENGNFGINKEEYRAALKQAAQDSSGNFYTGSHGLRWNHAQERMNELQEHGLKYEIALGVVSKELGHHRVSITRHYLGAK
jgi:hypothetical protein